MSESDFEKWLISNNNITDNFTKKAMRGAWDAALQSKLQPTIADHYNGLIEKCSSDKNCRKCVIFNQCKLYFTYNDDPPCSWHPLPTEIERVV
jgi:hypothetical protein